MQVPFGAKFLLAAIAVWLLLASPAIFVTVDILLHPEREEHYRQNGLPVLHSRTVRESSSNRAISPENLKKLEDRGSDMKARSDLLAQRIAELKTLREQQELLYTEIVELKGLESSYTLKSNLVAFFIGALSSLFATWLVWLARRWRTTKVP